MTALAWLGMLIQWAAAIDALVQPGNTSTGPGSPLEKLLSEVNAAIVGFSKQAGVPLTLADLESLRAKKMF